MNKQKGFTIIELIVVIAIIAVLASIVLVNVSSYINKGKDASIKGNMSQIATAAAIVMNDDGDYDNLGTNQTYTAAVTAITSANAAPTLVKASSSASAYCIKAALKDGTTWCIDNTGYVGALGANKCEGTTYTCQ